ncbi:MAG: ABC-F family ATP-binding cassette domain-containing protein [Rubellimicrobium sp.]|nr:ABC-F family ATP-binding cassette domain-containing protein [Rubellimicrobium sp.]
MARAPLLQLADVTLTFGGDPLLDSVSAVLQEGDRVALVGRNGSGKSTLLRLMAGLVAPDAGEVTRGPRVRLGYMEQDPDLSGHATLADFAESALPEDERWRAAAAAEGLGVDLARPVATASGGERRRAALARLMAGQPDLMLLDEPTNHLDIAAIQWLEAELAATRAAFVLISHDRAFLRGLTRATLWLDRGTLRRQEQGFEAFEAWRDRLWEEEDAARHRLDRKIRAEGRWAVEGISARRKRNMGRVRALQALREERRAQIRRQGTAALALAGGAASGREVIVARDLAKRFGDRVILRDFGLTVTRGERLAIVGPNGAGKTTLVNLLLGRIPPDAGTVRHGTNLQIAVLDQNRDALDPDVSLWQALTDAPGVGVSGQADQVMVQGSPRHVVGYLKDFLFTEAQAHSPVRALSGGEKARLLLARIMAGESNLLVLDEPTNDLDVETLDLLQEVLDGYAGTVILVSHDRDFLDRVATTTVVMEGDGRATVYAGGWSDMVAQRGSVPMAPAPAPDTPRAARPAAPTPEPPARSRGLSFSERHRLDELPALIDRLTAEIARLEGLMADPDLYSREPVKFRKASEALAARQEALSAAEDEWLTLAERAGD